MSNSPPALFVTVSKSVPCLGMRAAIVISRAAAVNAVSASYEAASHLPFASLSMGRQ